MSQPELNIFTYEFIKPDSCEACQISDINEFGYLVCPFSCKHDDLPRDKIDENCPMIEKTIRPDHPGYEKHFQEYLENQKFNERERKNFIDQINSGHLTLGLLIEKLSQYPEDYQVFIRSGNGLTSQLCSYRGIYSELAIIYSDNEDSGITNIQLLSELRKAINKKFHGYKGGWFHMHEDTFMYAVSCTSETGVPIVGVSHNPVHETILIITREDEQ